MKVVNDLILPLFRNFKLGINDFLHSLRYIYDLKLI